MKLRHLTIAALAASAATAATAQVLVVRASGPSANSYPAGKSIADSARITLQANDTLVVLDKRGTRTLRGPGTFTPGGPAVASNSSVIASAATAGNTRRARIGAVRGGTTSGARSPSLWHVDVARSSNICFTDPSKVALWRADMSKPVELTVTRVGDGATRKLNWAKGEATLDWPADLAVADGADYRLSWTGAAAPTNLEFRTLATVPADPAAIATTLIEHGCDAQLDLFIETVRAPDDPSRPSG